MGKRGDILFAFILLSIFLVLPSIDSASFYVEEDTNYTIRFTCEIDDAVCSTSALCNITIQYPNSSIFIDNQAASNYGNSIFAYNLTQNETSTKGEYNSIVVCYDGGSNGTASFIYEINPTGIRPTEQRTNTISRSVYFIFGLGILLFIAFLFYKSKLPVKLTFLIFSVMLFMVALNIIFIGLQDEIVNPRLESFFDSFTVISWIFYRFGLILLFVVWILSFLNTWLYKRNMQKLNKFGGE